MRKRCDYVVFIIFNPTLAHAALHLGLRAHTHACRLRPTLSLRFNRIPPQLKLMNKEEVAAAASLIEIALSPLFARQFAVKRRQNDAKSLLSTRVRRYRGVGAPSISKHQNSCSKLIINLVFLSITSALLRFGSPTRIKTLSQPPRT
jgi:hypothetical protein